MKMKPKTMVLRGAIGAAALIAVSGSAYAQFPVLGTPGGWKAFPQTSDEFNGTSLASKWIAVAKSEENKAKNGAVGMSRFRTQNVQFRGGNLSIINWWQANKITEGGTTFNYSGGWVRSSFGGLTEGQFQSQIKVGYVFPDVWPTFWTNRGGGDELDIMEYQTNILNQTHHWHISRPSRKSPREWRPADSGWRWAMDRVTGVGGLSNFAARSRRTSGAQFFINAKLEHTSTGVRNVTSAMEMLFTSSPHKNHLPAGAQNYPRYEVNWVRTVVP